MELNELEEKWISEEIKEIQKLEVKKHEIYNTEPYTKSDYEIIITLLKGRRAQLMYEITKKENEYKN